MRTNLQNNVPVENSKPKKSKFNRSYVVETSATIGEVQPYECRFVTPDTKNVRCDETLVRTAPLVRPAFGKQSLKKWNFFVPIESVMTMYPHMMAQQKVTRNGIMYDVKQMPRVDARYLSLYCLQGARCSIWLRANSVGSAVGRLRIDRWDYDHEDLPNHNGSYADKIDQVIDAIGWHLDSQGCPKLDMGRCFEYYYPESTSVGSRLASLHLDSGNITKSSFVLPASDWHDDYPDLNVHKGYTYGEPVTPAGADVIYERQVTVEDAEGLDETLNVTLCFQFSSWGQRFAKILRAAGIPVVFGCALDMRRFEGLLAQYMAYYSLFGVPQYENFEQSYCYDIIHRFDIDPSLCKDLGPQMTDSTELGEVMRNFFIKELGEMWLTENPDFVSAHTRQPTISPEAPFIEVKNEDMYDFNTSLYDVTDAAHEGTSSVVPLMSSDTRNEQGLQPRVSVPNGNPYTLSVNHSWFDSQLLMRMAKYANRNTVVGRVVSKLLDVMGLGDYMNQQKSHYLGYSEIRLNIQSLVSQSDTFDPATDSGSELGEYGGKCVGYEERGKKVTNQSNYAGYYISFFCVCVDATYMQGSDETTRAATKGQFYNPDADGLGMQLSAKSIINAEQPEGWSAHNPNAINGVVTSSNMAQSSFGFAPRYSQFKVARSFVNGGFADRSRRKAFCEYDQNKLFYVNESTCVPVPNIYGKDPNLSNDQVQYEMYRGLEVIDTPVAGKVWRYLGRYPWFENFNRIFSMQGKQPDWTLWAKGLSSYLLEKFNYHVRYEENYIVQIVVNSTDWSNMLPIDEGYGTVDLPERGEHYEQRS